MELLVWIEQTAFSIWTRESSWALFAFLIAHTISMGFALGTGVAINLRVLGLASRVPLPQLSRLMPVMYATLVVVLLSGILLLVAYPAKALTNPLFYVKLMVLIAALLLTRQLTIFSEANDVVPNRHKLIAIFNLLLWATGLTAGKYLEYTYKVLMAAS